MEGEGRRGMREEFESDSLDFPKLARELLVGKQNWTFSMFENTPCFNANFHSAPPFLSKPLPVAPLISRMAED